MKGDKKMTVICCVLGVIGVLLIAASFALASTNCGTSKAPSPTEGTVNGQSGTPVPTEDAEICGTSKAPSPTEGTVNGQSGTPVPTEDVETEAPAPGEITRMVLVEGLTLRGVEMTRPEGIEYILGMLDVDTYEAVDADDAEAADIIDRADVIVECYSGDELYGTVWVTNGCRVCVMIEGGGIYRTVTPAVDTVLITAEFGRKP